MSAKLSNPLGLCSPFIIGTKILFQILCKNKVGWDEELEGNLSKRWKQLITELEALSTIKAPRCYYLVGKVLVQGYTGFVMSQRRHTLLLLLYIYLRSVYCGGDTSVCLILSKTRGAPLKRQSIPRLELLGATILVQLIRIVLNCSTSNPEIYCWNCIVLDQKQQAMATVCPA